MTPYTHKTNYGKCPLCKTNITPRFGSFVGALSCSNIGCLISLGRFTEEQLNTSFKIRDEEDKAYGAKIYSKGYENGKTDSQNENPWLDVKHFTPTHSSKVDIMLESGFRMTGVEFIFGDFIHPAPKKMNRVIENVTHFMNIPKLTEQ